MDSMLAEHVGCPIAYEGSSISLCWYVGVASDECDGNAINFTHHQLCGPSELIGYGDHTGMEFIAVRIVLASIVRKWLQASYAYCHVHLSVTPGASPGVRDNNGDTEILTFSHQLLQAY